jgi:hypothetical protein
MNILTIHCNGNSKHIFSEMKLHGLVPNFYIYVSGSNFFPQLGLFGISIFLYCLRELCRSGEKGRELPPSIGWQQFPALPTAPVVEPRE